MSIKPEYLEFLFKNKVIVIILILFGLMSAVFFGLQDYRRSCISNVLADQLSTISPEGIEYIEVFLNEYGKKPILKRSMTSSSKSKSLFARAMSDLLPYSSGHDMAHRRFFIKMTDDEGNLYEYDAWMKMNDQNEMLMYISKMVSIDRSNFQSLGGKKSKGLYQWLKFHNLI